MLFHYMVEGTTMLANRTTDRVLSLVTLVAATTILLYLLFGPSG